MIKTQVREVTSALSQIDPRIPATEPSHIHIPRPSRVRQPAVDIHHDHDGDVPAQLILEDAA